MASETVLDVESIQSSSTSRTRCVVRCLQGALVEGQGLWAVDENGERIPSATPLVVVEMWRYERRVDLVDPPHNALVVLDGTLDPGGAKVRLVSESGGDPVAADVDRSR